MRIRNHKKHKRHKISQLVLVLLVVSSAAAPLLAQTPVTFNKDVLPILQKNCQSCHRPGEAAPMSLMDYKSVRPWAKAIKSAVLAKTMPPWFADPGYGQFENDRRLRESEIRTIASWVDAGSPEGDSAAARLTSIWREGWNIQTDVVLEMPRPYAVPQTGVLEYVYIVISTGFVKDTWITAAEVRPGARSVVHHASAIVRPPGSAWLRDAKPGVAYIPDPNSHDGQPGSTDPQAALIDGSEEFLAGYAPGMQPQRFDVDHSAKRIPAGSDIVLQIHYTPNGKAGALDRTRIGLTLARTPPIKEFYTATALSSRWEIPPGDPDYEGHARLTFGEPVELVFIQPHMHLRGKDVTVRVTYPSGQSETLLSVPHYSFAWQIVYYLKKPVALPAGARIEVTAHWDNSANNPANPDPTKTVRWGNQSADEMLSVPMGVIISGMPQLNR